VWDRVRRQDQTNALCPSRTRRTSPFLLLSLLLPVYPSLSLQRRLRRCGVSFPFTVAPELSRKHATSFSLLRTQVAVVASLFLFPSFLATTRHRFSLVVLVLCLLPSLFVRCRATSDPCRRVSIIGDKFNFHLITTRPPANAMKLEL